MKILKINISGYRLLKDNFEINFLNKARVKKFEKDDEIIEIDENLYYPTTTIFTGKNASGKTTLVNLLEFVGAFLNEGRIEYNKFDFRNEKIQLTVHFYLDGFIYQYEGNILPPEKSLSFKEEEFCNFGEEKLLSLKYYKSYYNNIFSDSMSYKIESGYRSEFIDQSILYSLTRKRIAVINSKQEGYFSYEMPFNIFYHYNIPKPLMLKVIQLFDNSIEDFNYNYESELYELNIKGIGRKQCIDYDISELLSDGTKKGMFLSAFAIMALKTGGTLIIDEVENSFSKNLVEYILDIFNDKKVNKNKANLMLTTHDLDILDLVKRRDCIFVMEKNKYISAKNLYEDFDVRGDLSKSNQFKSNAFNTLTDNERLKDLKNEIIITISNNE